MAVIAIEAVRKHQPPSTITICSEMTFSWKWQKLIWIDRLQCVSTFWICFHLIYIFASFATTLLINCFFLHSFTLSYHRINIYCAKNVGNGISQIGLCVSGQTIRDALSRLHNYPNVDRMKLIINIGSVDILHGTGLSDMCNDFINLVRLCERRNIYIVITTLAPLGNRLHVKEEVERLKKFNQFLISTFASKHQVVDVTKCMLDPTQNAVYMGCYQPYVYLFLLKRSLH